MTILNQRRDTLVNYDSVSTIRLISQYIQASIGSTTVTLGTYETQERAAEVFSELTEQMEVVTYSTMYNNVPLFTESTELYVMPEV